MKPISVLSAEGGPKARPVLAAVSIACAAFVLLLFGLGSVAFAQECSVTDLTCVTDTVGGPANGVGPTTDDIKGTVQDTASQAADDVQGVLDGLIGPGEPPGGGGGGGPGGGNHDGPGDGRGDGNGNQGGGSSGGGVRAPAIGGASVLAREGGGLLLGAATDRKGSTNPSAPTPGAATRLREAATGIALPLLIVLAALLLFTAVQDRLDRREPRLALAPVTGDVVTFR
jgi:hypothetical protein